MKNRNFYIFVTSDYHSFIYQNLKFIGLLGEKLYYLISLRIQIEVDFHFANTRIKFHLFGTLKLYLYDKSLKHGRKTATIKSKNFLHRICNRTIALWSKFKTVMTSLYKLCTAGHIFSTYEDVQYE